MQVRDVMKPIVTTATPDTTLRAAAEMMDSMQVEPLPVCLDGRLQGVVARDALNSAAERAGLGAAGETIADLVAPDTLHVGPADDVESTLERLGQDDALTPTTAIPVIGENGALVGVVSLQEMRRGAAPEDDGVAAAQNVESISSLVSFPQDHVEYESDESFPASDPMPPPSSMGSGGDESEGR